MTAVYHNQLALRQAAHPEKFFGREVKEALPVRKTDICEYWCCESISLDTPVDVAPCS